MQRSVDGSCRKACVGMLSVIRHVVWRHLHRCGAVVEVAIRRAMPLAGASLSFRMLWELERFSSLGTRKVTSVMPLETAENELTSTRG